MSNERKWTSVFRYKSEIAERLGISYYTFQMELENEELKKELEAVGYNKYQKKISPKQLSIIESFIGELNF